MGAIASPAKDKMQQRPHPGARDVEPITSVVDSSPTNHDDSEFHLSLSLSLSLSRENLTYIARSFISRLGSVGFGWVRLGSVHENKSQKNACEERVREKTKNTAHTR